MIKLLMEINSKTDMKMESNIKCQNKNFEMWKARMKTTQNFKGQKRTLIKI